MFDDDRTYYQHRAEAEIQRAQRATEPCAVKAHYELAEAYLERVATLQRTGTNPA